MKMTAIDIIRKIMLKIEQPKPPHETMRKEIQLMKFKIRPVVGDIANLKKMDNQIVEILWQVGKIDEIVHRSFDDLNEDDQDRLLEYLQHVELKAQEDMRNLIRSSRSNRKSKALKIEIFKEHSEDPILN